MWPKTRATAALALAVAAVAAIPPGELTMSVSTWSETPSFAVTANLVEVDVVVRDRDGRAVPGLTKADFSVFDNGRLQALNGFSQLESETPPLRRPPQQNQHPNPRRPRSPMPAPPPPPPRRRQARRAPSPSSSTTCTRPIRT